MVREWNNRITTKRHSDLGNGISGAFILPQLGDSAVQFPDLPNFSRIGKRKVVCPFRRVRGEYTLIFIPSHVDFEGKLVSHAYLFVHLHLYFKSTNCRLLYFMVKWTVSVDVTNTSSLLMIVGSFVCTHSPFFFHSGTREPSGHNRRMIQPGRVWPGRKSKGIPRC